VLPAAKERKRVKRRPAYHLLTRPSPRVEKFLGELEAPVMEFLWEHGPATVREVADAIGARRPVAYTTVMTVMVRLTEKGLLRRTGDRRRFVYAPAMDREAFLRRLSGRIIEDLVADFGEVAIAQFVDTIQRLAPERLAALKALAEGAPPAPERQASGSEDAPPTGNRQAPERERGLRQASGSEDAPQAAGGAGAHWRQARSSGEEQSGAGQP
jgi:predicted transcriptional regulator